MDLAVLLLIYCLCDLFELHHCDQSSTVNVISFLLFAQGPVMLASFPVLHYSYRRLQYE